jgi:hypothetical protein
LINIFLILNFILFISFFKIDIFIIFIFLLISSLFFNILYLKKILKIKIHFNNKLHFLFFLTLCSAIFFQIAENPKLEWDGVLHWVDKATNFYQNLPIQNFKNLNWSDYPHLGSYIWALFWKGSLLELEYSGRYFYVFFYILSIISITEILIGDSNKTIGRIITCAIIFQLTYDKFLFGGYQEYLIFSTLVSLSKFIFLYQKQKNNGFFFLLIIISGAHLLLWFKHEGLVFFIMLMISILFINKKNRYKAIILVLTVLIVTNQFFIKKFVIGIDGFSGFSIPWLNSSTIQFIDIKILLKNIVTIAQFIIISFLKYPIWLVNIIILPAIFIKHKYIVKEIKWLFIFFILNFLFIFFIYLNTDLNLEWHLRVSLDRVLFQTSGMYLILLTIFLKSFFKKTK